MGKHLCGTCIHRGDYPEAGCSHPDLYDFEHDANEEHGTDAKMGEAIQTWRDNGLRYRGLRVTQHDGPCPGWEGS